VKIKTVCRDNLLPPSLGFYHMRIGEEIYSPVNRAQMIFIPLSAVNLVGY